MRLKSVLVGLIAASLVLAGSCTQAPPLTPPTIEEIEQGKLEICTDPRWAQFRFGGREADLETLHAEVKARLQAAGKENAGWASTPVISRLTAADAILSAVKDAEVEAAFASSQAAAARLVQEAEASATAIKGDDFNARQQRFAIWMEQQLVVRSAFEVGKTRDANAMACRLRPGFRDAALSLSKRFLEIAAVLGWPNDATDGEGAAFTALSVNRGMVLKDEGEAACARLGASGGMERGAAALMRVKLKCDPKPPATAEAWLERFEGDFPKVKALLDAIPIRLLGDELTTRFELDQYGRLANIEFNQRFPEAAKDQKTMRRGWALVEAADHANTARLKELLAARDWFDDSVDGAQAQNHAWLMVQHADDDPAFQRMILGRLEKYIGTPRVESADYALLWDRVAVKDKRPQRYASQVNCRDGKWAALGEIEEPAKLDERRTRMGLEPFAEYSKVITEMYGPCQG